MVKRKIGFVEWPEDLDPGSSQWSEIYHTVNAAGLDLLVTNEMPFGPWLAEGEKFDLIHAKHSVNCHERGLDALLELEVGAVVSSRPRFMNAGLVNEAFLLEKGEYRAIHQKQYFPQETGYFEATWFRTEVSGFDTVNAAGINIGVLLCTELFFNEHARAYGKLGADLIVVPRATGRIEPHWTVAASMAAIVSGSYVVSSNRIGRSIGGTEFGGVGLVYSPRGKAGDKLTLGNGLFVTEINLDVAKKQKSVYPCYVADKSI
ncbi:carbon-nitrogen hydrolase family protein [Pseudomonas sp. NA-150]|uniref:carbon-nitrogen hydrolase family protein n=1 Tax=Pseudomonas sp. NA-150 TaxID=3367525 RepID=UPI0037C6ECD6